MNVSGLGSFSLDGVIYRFEALNPLEAMRFGNRVFKVFGPALNRRPSCSPLRRAAWLCIFPMR